MNRRATANCRYQPTCYEHAANFYTHAVRLQTLSASSHPFSPPLVYYISHVLFFIFPTSAPHRAGLRGHGAAAPPVGHRLGADHRLGLRPGAVRALPGLHRFPHHHLEEESHEVSRPGPFCISDFLLWRRPHRALWPPPHTHTHPHRYQYLFNKCVPPPCDVFTPQSLTEHLRPHDTATKTSTPDH